MDASDFEEEAILARMVLKNAFYRDFSAMVNRYLQAVEGIDPPGFEGFDYSLQDGLSIFGRDDNAKGYHALSIQTESDGVLTTHETMLDALNDRGASRLIINDEPVFEMREFGWFLITDQYPKTLQVDSPSP